MATARRPTANRTPAQAPRRTASAAPVRRAAARRPAASSGGGGKGPGIGQGKRGQRLRQGADDYVSPNIATEPGFEFGPSYGAYDSGSTMDQIRRNEYLNTLSLADRERAMAHMGYFTGGVPTAVPKTSVKDIRQYASQHTSPGTYIMPNRSGQFTIGADGKVSSVEAYRPTGRRDDRPAGPNRPGGAKGTGKGRPGQGRFHDGNPKNNGRRGAGRRGAGRRGPKGSSGPLPATDGAIADNSPPSVIGELFVPYAEADVTTTSMLNAQGKAYAKSRRGRSGYQQGQDRQRTGEEGESTVVEEAGTGSTAKRGGKRTTRKKNKKGATVVRTRKGGKVVKKTNQRTGKTTRPTARKAPPKKRR